MILILSYAYQCDGHTKLGSMSQIAAGTVHLLAQKISEEPRVIAERFLEKIEEKKILTDIKDFQLTGIDRGDVIDPSEIDDPFLKGIKGHLSRLITERKNDDEE